MVILVIVADPDEPTLPVGPGPWYLHAYACVVGKEKNWTRDPRVADVFISQNTAHHTAKRKNATRYHIEERPLTVDLQSMPANRNHS